MAVSNVYYTNMRTTLTENLLQKLERLVKKAGMMDIDFNNKYTAIKIHFGEPGNLAYLLQGPGGFNPVPKRQSIPDRLQYPLCGKKEECIGPPGRCL